MCVYNIESKKKNDSKFDEKDDRYEPLLEYRPQDYKDLQTLKSHQGESYLANSNNRAKTIQNQITALGNQMDTLNRNLCATEFKFELNWNLFVWISGIGTIVRLVQRYLLNQNLLEIQNRIGNLTNTKQRLELQKQNFKEETRKNCEKKKEDYKDSLKKAKGAMKKWGKREKDKDYPYDKHEKYSQLLKQIIDIYEKDQKLSLIDMSSGNEAPLQENETIQISRNSTQIVQIK